MGLDNIAEEQKVNQSWALFSIQIISVMIGKCRRLKIHFGILSKLGQPEICGYVTEISHCTNQKGKRTSKGMQMKLMLACAFSYDAKLLILDEPTSGLDPVSRDEL